MNTNKTKYEVFPLNENVFYLAKTTSGFVATGRFGPDGLPEYRYEEILTATPPSAAWNIDLAIRFARQLNSLLARAIVLDYQKAHVAITGGVLLNGRSEKDLDLIVFPHQSEDATFPGWETSVVAALNKYLTEFYKFEPLIPCEGYGDKTRDDKKVWYATRKADNRKVDFFFLS